MPAMTTAPPITHIATYEPHVKTRTVPAAGPSMNTNSVITESRANADLRIFAGMTTEREVRTIEKTGIENSPATKTAGRRSPNGKNGAIAQKARLTMIGGMRVRASPFVSMSRPRHGAEIAAPRVEEVTTRPAIM